MKYITRLTLDRVRDEDERIVDMAIKQMIANMRVTQSITRVELPESFPVVYDTLYNKLRWVISMSVSPLVAATQEQLQVRLAALRHVREAQKFDTGISDSEQFDRMHTLMRYALPPTERASIDNMNAQWMLMIGNAKAQAFVLEPDIIKAVADARVGENDHPVMFPYQNIWVEPLEQMRNPLAESEILLGATMARPYTVDAEYSDKQRKWLLEASNDMPYKQQQEIRSTHGRMEYHCVHSRMPENVKRITHWEYFPQSLNKGYNDDGVIDDQPIFPGADCKPTKLTVRLLSYLVSSNIEYELVTRKPPRGAGARRRKHVAPYYVTRMKKRYVRGISTDDSHQSNHRYSFRFKVAGHFYKPWYCSKCDKRQSIRRFLSEEKCVRCGEPLCKLDARVRVFWQIEHFKGPDVADQAQRKAYLGDDDVPPKTGDQA